MLVINRHLWACGPMIYKLHGPAAQYLLVIIGPGPSARGPILDNKIIIRKGLRIGLGPAAQSLCLRKFNHQERRPAQS